MQNIPLNNTLTAVPGIRVGHAQDWQALTGCSVILCPPGTVGGGDQRGGAPGTRQTDALRPMHLVQEVHAVVLAGGSAYGLESATGVMRFLEADGVGMDVGVARVPIVPAAVLFDLNFGRSDVRPDAAMGYLAAQNASSAPVAEGNYGAGAGATVGKALGIEQAMKAGIGSASLDLGSGVVVAALAAVNAFGDIIDPTSGKIIAGARLPGETFSGFADTLQLFRALIGKKGLQFGRGENTVIGVVATNARLSKDHVNKVAQMAHDGLARTVRPAHTMLDGDTIFALATGEHEVDVNVIGAYAAEAFALAVLRAVHAAEPLGGLPTVASLKIKTVGISPYAHSGSG